MTTVAELDAVFAQQSAANYWQVIHNAEPEVNEENFMGRVMLAERDAILCSSLHQASCEATNSGKCVVALVGALLRLERNVCLPAYVHLKDTRAFVSLPFCRPADSINNAKHVLKVILCGT